MQEEKRPEHPKKEKKKRSVPARVGRIVLKTLLFLLLFIILVFLIILTPPAQRFLTGKVENYLEKKLQTRVDIKRISFGLSGNVSLENVYIEDRTKDTLISGGSIKAHLNFMKLFSNEVEVKDIELMVKERAYFKSAGVYDRTDVKRFLPLAVFILHHDLLGGD